MTCFRKLRLVLLIGLAVSTVRQSTARAQDLQALEDRAIQAAVDHAAPAVLRIETLGGLERVGQLVVGNGPTTGLAVSEDGYIVSSAFNFAQKPSSILVTMPSGKRATAEIVARDHSRMLVLLKVNSSEKLKVLEAVPRSELVVGQWTIALGRTFDPEHVNMSVGVLSATNRIWGKAIQTDAKISPSNYGGPLTDIRGRVLGVLVPLSPQATGEVAGAEWYDSGIGFAVPLDEILPHLEKMKQGEDLHAGILGVSLQRGDVYTLDAEVAACPVNSPAGKAGIRPGDKIVEIDGEKIARQSQLKHALGGRYAGETVSVVLTRGDERLEKSVTLIDQLLPYEHPFLGVLPLRDADPAAGVAVRFVYPDGPATEAGLQLADRILSIAGQEAATALAMQDLVARHEPGEQIEITFQRGEQKLNAQVTLANLPTEIPGELPPGRAQAAAAAAPLPPVGVVEIKIPEEKNNCFAYVPENYHPDVPHGLLVWLHAADDFNQEALVNRWKELCERNGVILLAPQAADPAKWLPTEVEFIRKAVDAVLADYEVDRTRIVAHGFQAGGAMAYLVAFTERELIRGVAAVDAPVPARTRPPANDPLQRLAVYTASAEGSLFAAQIQAGVSALENLKYPVTVKRLPAGRGYLDADELAELLRWLDTLDRI